MRQKVVRNTRPSHIVMRWVVFLLLAASCRAQAADTPATTSSWGEIITLGEAEQLDAPSIWTTEDQFTAAWVGADDTGIHQDIRALDADGLTERVVLPLPPKNPRQQMWLPSTNRNLHLLWLDQNDEEDTRLYTAIITPELAVERGPIQLTDETTYHYGALANGDGSLWVVSSGGMAFEPGLYARYLDTEGRPRPQETYQITSDGDWPTLVSTNEGTVYLFWIQPSDGQVKRAALVNGVMNSAETITQTVPLNTGDRLMGFSAGLDRTHAYLFWNITRGNGDAETWFASGQLDGEIWEQPRRLGIEASSEPFETGFNSGATHAAHEGENWLRWTTPIVGQFDILAAASLLPTQQLGILYFQDGEITGVQDVAGVTDMMGAPALLTDRDRFLYLAWSEPSASGQATLRMTTSRRSS